MKTRLTTKPRPARRIGEATDFETSTHWFMAALLFGAAIACVWFFKLSFDFDLDSPDFNPLVAVPIVLALFGLRPLALAIRHTMLARQFGESALEMDGESVPPGGTLKGTIRTSAALTPQGDYQIWLRCIEAIRVESPSEPTGSRTEDHIRWEALRRVEARGVNSKAGIPFEFAIPETALAVSDPRAKGQVRWIVEITAPLPGLDYYALFGVIVRPKGR
jgi:hypothetical protein